MECFLLYEKIKSVTIVIRMLSRVLFFSWKMRRGASGQLGMAKPGSSFNCWRKVLLDYYCMLGLILFKMQQISLSILSFSMYGIQKIQFILPSTKHLVQ